MVDAPSSATQGLLSTQQNNPAFDQAFGQALFAAGMTMLSLNQQNLQTALKQLQDAAKERKQADGE